MHVSGMRAPSSGDVCLGDLVEVAEGLVVPACGQGCGDC
jgi:hypothetical protein